jgi:hypothetical protein
MMAAKAAASTCRELRVAPAGREHQRCGGSAFGKNCTHAISLGVHLPAPIPFIASDPADR